MTANPPTVGINHFALASNATEVLVTFGCSRVSLTEHPTDSGRVIVNAVVEWLHTASISPVAAMQLHQRLGQVLMDYAATYGSIPVDQRMHAHEGTAN